MDFQGLTDMELGSLLYALELEYEIVENNYHKHILAHKIGMGKPLGLGSIGIRITGGNIEKGAVRYRSFKPQAADEVKTPQDLRAQIEHFRKKASQKNAFQLSEALRDLLSISKYTQGDIQYPGYHWFRANNRKPLGTWGEFEGMLGQAVRPDSITATSVPLSPGTILNGRTVNIHGDTMIVQTDDGTRYQRNKEAVQGVKADKIMVDLEVSLKGNAVFLRGKAPK